jgi:hypothetical protein
MKPEIENSGKLSSIFGRWPSFHDAEVWSFCQERTEAGFDVLASIHVFEMTSDVTAAGHFRLQKHTRVTLRFIDSDQASFRWFNHQNVLSDLMVELASAGCSRPIKVTFESCHGLDGELLCRKVKVVEAIPWQPTSGAYAQEQA